MNLPEYRQAIESPVNTCTRPEFAKPFRVGGIVSSKINDGV